MTAKNKVAYAGLKTIWVLIILALTATSCSSSPGKTFGSPIDEKKGTFVTLAQIYADPAKYEGNNIILEAEAGLICQASGCWVMLTDGSHQILAQFFSFTVRPPKGSILRVQGVLKTQNQVPYLATEGLEIIR